MNNEMICPSIVDLLKKVDNRYLSCSNIKKSETNNRRSKPTCTGGFY